MADGSATDKDMITVITQECNEISQKLYDTAISAKEKHPPDYTIKIFCFSSDGTKRLFVGMKGIKFPRVNN